MKLGTITKVYKVVIATGAGYVSAYHHNHQLKYPIGEWTYPEIGRIFVFDNLKNALVIEAPHHRVFEAEAVNIQPIEKIASILDDFNAYWRGVENMDLRCPPTGTMTCDAVKLVRKV